LIDRLIRVGSGSRIRMGDSNPSKTPTRINCENPS